MKLKAFVASLDDVPEAFRELYSQSADGFVLDLEDTDFKSKLSEFRDNNIALRRKVDEFGKSEEELSKLRELAKKYDGLDPEKAKAALDQLAELEEKNLLDAGKLDEVVAQRTERMRQDYEGRMKAMQTQLEKEKGSSGHFRKLYSNTVIDSSLQGAVNEVATVRSGAMQDILARGRGTWTVDEDGNLIPRDAQGNVRYGKDGNSPITTKEWAESLVLDAPYLFEASSGGGSNSNRNTGGTGQRVAYGDQDAINANIEDIASGKVQVVEQ